MELIKKRISKHWPLLSKGVLKARPLQGVTSPTTPLPPGLIRPFQPMVEGACPGVEQSSTGYRPEARGSAPKSHFHNLKRMKYLWPTLKQTRNTLKKDKIIYAIISPFDKQSYVGAVLKKAAKNRYKEHNILRISYTNNLFAEVKSKNKMPKCIC